MNKWADLDYYNKNVRRIQLPFNITTPALTPEQQLARRKELAKKLVEMNARKREERVRSILIFSCLSVCFYCEFLFF